MLSVIENIPTAPRRFILSKPQNNLATYLKDTLLLKNLTTIQVSRRAKGKGHSLDQSYVSKLKNGDSVNVTIDKIEALADGLDVPLQEVFDAITGRKENPEIIQHQRLIKIDERYLTLDEKTRSRVDYLLDIAEREMNYHNQLPDSLKTNFENDLSGIKLDPRHDKKKRAKN